MDYFLTRNVIFKNPNNIPLNELNLEIKKCKRTKKPLNDIESNKERLKDNFNIITEKHPALHSSWIQANRHYIYYQPYYIEVSSEENASYLIKNRQFLECIDFLLQCTFQQFWCYIIHEQRVLRLLKSFIYNASPWYELKQFDEKSLLLYNEIYDKIARVYGRLICYRASESEYMSQSTILRLIDENHFLSLPIIMNLCTLYKHTNLNLINDYITVYFRLDRETFYIDELKKMFDHLLVVFEVVGGELCGYNKEKPKIQVGIRNKPHRFDLLWYEEVALFLLDTATNLNGFLSVCQPAVELAIKMKVPNRLAYFYNAIFPTMYKDINGRSLSEDLLKLLKKLKTYLALTRCEFTAAFHTFVAYFIDGIVKAQSNRVKQADYLDEYITLISSILEDEFFMFDYHNSNEIDLQLQMIADIYPEIDTMRTNYIIECLSTFPNLRELTTPKVVDHLHFSQPSTSNTSKPSTSKQQQVDVAEMHKLSNDEIDKRIHVVLDTLPYLGDGFIYKCLEVYDYDPYNVISAILDNNLSPILKDVDTDLIRVPPDRDVAQPQPKLVYRGKKPATYKDATDMLNDKTHMSEVKNYVLKTSRMTYDMYDDEYDDREDEEPTPLKNADEADPYKYMENRFADYERVSDPSSSDHDDDEEEDNGRNGGGEQSATSKMMRKTKKFQPFCTDPAIMREQREAHFRNKGRGGGGGANVVGKPKGQGQEKSVQQSRDKKNVNKSSRANHSRKGGAQWKRNKGMIPS